MAAFPGELDQGWRRRVRSRILRWYKTHGRSLPWRESQDAYRIWISEIMLQQTTVAAVVPYFDRFLAAFPDVHTLASAAQEEVLKQWEGLGYYSRARNLHKAANVIVRDYDGRFPETVDALQALPGIGPYTAGAIASFAFNVPAPIVEANTIRLYSRLINMEDDPRSTAGQKLLWKFAAWIVARRKPADFNQAVMDIGSQICRPADPDCRHCPLIASCQAFECGSQNRIPLQAEKTKFTEVTELAIAVERRGKWLVRQRRADERWAGLFDFVRFEVSDSVADRIPIAKTKVRSRHPSRQQPSLFNLDQMDDRLPLPEPAIQTAYDDTGLRLSKCRPITTIRHTVTRYRIRLLCVTASVDEGRVRQDSGYRWVDLQDLDQIPLSKTGRQFAELLLASEP